VNWSTNTYAPTTPELLLFLANEVVAGFEHVNERHLQENNEIFKR
jgi:hypothetical protein